MTRAELDKAMRRVLQQGVTPDHNCRLDGHIMCWNPHGFMWCTRCNRSEADLERPE